jgi:hypothetical protein
MDQQPKLLTPLTQEPTPGFPVQIYPLDNHLEDIILEKHANKHLFQYNPEMGDYMYQGRIPIATVKAKRKRLLDLLHDYALFLTEVIEIRRPELNNEELSWLSRVRDGLLEKRGSFNLEEKHLVIFEKLLKDFEPCYECRAMSKLELFGDICPENTIEMLYLLGDDDCAEIRQVWEKVFFLHIQETIEDVLEYSPFERLTMKTIPERTPWANLMEKGNYADLVLYYFAEAPENVRPANTTEEEHQMEEKTSGHMNLERFHPMVTRNRRKELAGS